MDARPVINIPYSYLEMLFETASILGILFAIVLASNLSRLPDTVPIHFGLNGKPDGWGSKKLFVLYPILCLILYIGFTFLQRYPNTYNYPVPLTPQNIEQQYHIARTMIVILKMELVWVFALIEWQAIRVASGEAQKLNPWVMALITVVPMLTIGLNIYLAYQAR